MADRRGSGADDEAPRPPPQPPRERAGSMPVLDSAPKQKQDIEPDRDAVLSPKQIADGANTVQWDPPQPGVDPALAKQVEEVMASELGISTLLNRLKQSVASAKEFAIFLKRRSVLEDDHAQGLKKLCRLNQESARRPEHRQGSFAQSYDEMIFIHDRMAENGSQFAASLHQMHEDLLELAATAERGRKSWKTNGMAAEQKVVDLEQAMRKSKAKYDSLADEYDRARTGEARQSGKMLGAFKAHKSAAQQEEDLLKKVQAADQAYHGHVNALQTEKSHLVTMARPEAVQALQDLIVETDSAVTLQMQKFAAFSEKLLLGNGLIVSPFKGQAPSSPSQPRSLREAVAAIDNTKDLNDFVAAQHAKIQPKSEVKYERNPILNPPSSAAANQPTPLNMHPPQTSGQTSGATQEAPREFPMPHTRSFSQGAMLNQQGGPPQQFAPRNSAQAAPRYGTGGTITSQGPPRLGALPFQASQSSGQQPQQSGSPPLPSQDKQNSGGAPPGYGPPGQGSASKPIFGVPLARLYERDGLAVPMVVHQCIQAVDLFGLGVEGIYRQSGSFNHISKLKGMFDAESQNPALDFRNPENFYHDVNSVTGLLKQFFRDLPDPILTMEHHDAFIAAAKKDDDVVRRDSLHAIINALPDPNYATLRALALHLYRVMDNSHVNRMNSHNLAVIFGPTLMGSDPSTAITDAGWQIKVIDTILQNTYQIFDED
ncbi:rhoGAP domain-containing protein [Hirsutella rhossiliensis]|uniref:RhoGAP domain-containing protein n=1 Tax=Hirsutella rhossiliensis TaxID=111463 RepID=A0A9P8SIW2_9HYPO|nr:rhoGAP domain-containing protein [Hirsutella rhossiliensis]KAH0964306.1 rhoGAP domain-containing protein [Hirsutella rhossiliensis]